MSRDGGVNSSRTSTDSSGFDPYDTITADPTLGEAGNNYYDKDETFSVTSSIYDYRYENGRTYHRYRDGAYVLPNDEIEKDRLDILHHLYLLVLGGKLTLAPIDTPRRILDVGTGTGIWAITIADLLPETSEVTGTDLSPIQPEWVPPNCHFEIDDAESDWTFPPNYFDFIHSRGLSLAIRDWAGYIKRLYHHLAPGGYIELVEHNLGCNSDDDTLSATDPLYIYCQHLSDCAAKMGLLLQPGSFLRRLVKEAGFVDVKYTPKKIPWGPWPEDQRLKELGRWARLGLTTGVEAYGMALLTRVNGMSSDKAKQLCDEAVKVTKDHRTHVYNTHHYFVARKPWPGEVVQPENASGGA